MSSITNIPLPKITYRFLLKFMTVAGILDETSYALSQNIMTVSEYSEPIPGSAYVPSRETVTFTFKDDSTDLVYDGIQILKYSKELKIVLEYMDGNDTVLRAVEFEEPIIAKVTYGKLNYGVNETVTLDMVVSYTDIIKIK